ncbi:hypothetical protein [Oceanicoccus sp. KOV_DT_Chl]|uniref:hypothetical protein n=1 Tax=Oceanicoccus sp. KOV_DT_Chl TaxID=1904639 RepID=UPI000C7AA9E0|nr:hypothetical protein [Oceanicoccus sp. KOV_DT_Chl]
MTLEVSINLNSLKVIQEELGNTITQSGNELEAYIADQNNEGHIKACHEAIAQVGGIFRLLEYPGAALLADEMAALVAVIADPERKTTDTMVNALTHAYFVLPRYIEFITVRQSELPILVIPYVNELRASRRESLLAESLFYRGNIPLLGMMMGDHGAPDLRLLLASLPRLRQMYQTGLVGVLKQPNSSPHYLFMTRAVTRIVSLLGNHPQAEIWQLAILVLNAFAAGKLEVTLNRKRNFGEIEKLMRLVVSKGEEGLNQLDVTSLKRDLLFMLMLTDYSSAELDAVREAYSLPQMDLTDTQISQQRAAMHGPSQDTIESVIKVLAEELRSAKDILEIASQNQSIELEDLDILSQIVARVSDTLSILNLTGPKQILDEQLEKIKAWSNNPKQVDSASFLTAADNLLYIDSALSGLDRREITIDDLNQANALARKKIIANSQFGQAEQLVLEEAQAGISLAKRAITSYVDSNFDSAHIANVGTTLNTVRGGLHILNYHRAAAVLKGCSDFVAHHIRERSPGDQRHQLLETLADALISLEYYLTELEGSRNVNEDILLVAEESLAALGFAVVPAK